jgi:hypothetical protein
MNLLPRQLTKAQTIASSISGLSPLTGAREIGLEVQIVNSHLNAWSKLAGTELYWQENVGLIADGTEHWQPHLEFDACYNSYDNKIYRAHINDTDKKVYVQTITNFGTASEWTTWTVLASCQTPCRGVCIWPKAGAAGYHLLYTLELDGTTKTGIYDENNTAATSSMFAPSAGAAGHPYRISVVRPNNAWALVQVQATHPVDTYDQFNYYWFRLSDYAYDNIDWTSDAWFHNDMVGYYDTDGYHILQNAPILSDTNRDMSQGTVMAHHLNPSAYPWRSWGEDTRSILMNASGSAYTRIYDPYLTKLSDGYWYLFYSEEISNPSTSPAAQVEASGNSQFRPLSWRRSKDCINWSEPVLAGIAGTVRIVEPGDGYVYACGYSQVYRRPTAATTYDLSDYTMTARLSMPRDNQPGSGSLSVANPEGVNGTVRDLAGRRCYVRPMVRDHNGQWVRSEPGAWWIKDVDQARTDKNPAVNRLSVSLGDVYSQLQNTLRDVVNFPGKQAWSDWADGCPNQLFNYFFYNDEAPTITATSQISSKGAIIYTGWKGYNCHVEVTVDSAPADSVTLYARYVDEKNYVYFRRALDNSFSFGQCVDGTESPFQVWSRLGSITYPYTLSLDLSWGRYIALLDGLDPLLDVVPTVMTDVETVTNLTYLVQHKGYVGFNGGSTTAVSVFSHFVFSETARALTATDLFKAALARADYHDVSVDYASPSDVVATAWGPGTDMPTVEDALKKLLESEKAVMAFRGGKLRINQYSDYVSPILTVADQIIEFTENNSGDRRINVAIVDGNEHTYISADVTDLQARDAAISQYFDLPELLTAAAAQARAEEEIYRSRIGTSKGGTLVYPFDLEAQDVVTWVDQFGTSQVVRLEGITIDIDQGVKPHQHMEVDTSLVVGDRLTRIPTSERVTW